MTHSHRAHRRRKRTRPAARLGVLGAVVGMVAVVVMIGVVLVLRPGGEGSEPAAATSDAATPRRIHLRTGPKLDVRTPGGYAYSLAAVRGGTGDRPLPDDRTAPPSGTTHAYIDYVLTNRQNRPALLDFPGDLFVQRDRVPPETADRCMPQPGAPEDMCTLPNHSEIVNDLGSPPVITKGADRYLAPNASYLVRVGTDLAVDDDITQRDLGLYVWSPRFVPDRRAVHVAFPDASATPHP